MTWWGWIIVAVLVLIVAVLMGAINGATRR